MHAPMYVVMLLLRMFSWLKLDAIVVFVEQVGDELTKKFLCVPLAALIIVFNL